MSDPRIDRESRHCEPCINSEWHDHCPGIESAGGEAERELASIDDLLARRPALAGLATRREKIEKALRVAKMNDPNDKGGEPVAWGCDYCGWLEWFRIETNDDDKAQAEHDLPENSGVCREDVVALGKWGGGGR